MLNKCGVPEMYSCSYVDQQLSLLFQFLNKILKYGFSVLTISQLSINVYISQISFSWLLKSFKSLWLSCNYLHKVYLQIQLAIRQKIIIIQNPLISINFGFLYILSIFLPLPFAFCRIHLCKHKHILKEYRTLLFEYVRLQDYYIESY